jgi:hypothetical protein
LEASGTIPPVAQKAFTLEVRPKTGQLTVATQYLGECSSQFDIYAQLVATGGTGTGYTWSVAPGSTLPTGMSLQASGLLVGKPTMPGPFTIAIQVVDSASNLASREFDVEVITGGPSRPLFANSPANEIRERSVFLLDATPSMAGAKSITLRNQMIAQVNSLPPYYKFDLVAYGDQFGISAGYNTKCWGATLFATASNRAAAINWLNGPAMNPAGSTSPLAEPLGTCLSWYSGYQLKSFVAVTDGVSSSSSQILANFPTWWSVYDDCFLTAASVGGGGASFMQQLATLSGGSYIAI